MDDANVLFGQSQKSRQLVPGHKRSLGPGPDGGAVGPDIRHGTGGAEHAVQLEGPTVGGLKSPARAGKRLVHVALLYRIHVNDALGIL